MKYLTYAQKNRERIFAVINEYGDLLGIVCLEDMLEIIFGEFTTNYFAYKYIANISDNELIIDGRMSLRELKRLYNINLNFPAGVNTINGLAMYVLQTIPTNGLSFKLKNIVFEIIKVGDYWVDKLKILILK